MMRSTCPYRSQPSTALWREAVGGVPTAAINPTSKSDIGIDRSTVVASAGSCFAQHIRNQLTNRGYNFLITEPGPDGLDEDERADLSYGVFSARFGNIYTATQLLQLFERAFGTFAPAEISWTNDGSRVFDPFRPHVEPDGFASVDALMADRDRHLAATREMFETMEVFIFTLGLTEAWRSRIDGAVFPVCPGCSVGEFDPTRHEFINFDADATSDALFLFLNKLKVVNPSAHVILTVSPVPLAATMTDRHVVEATTYSKAVLRVAAEKTRKSFSNVDYFPSYEIITGSYRTHDYFAGDKRTITPTGVERVMDLFFHRHAGEKLELPASTETGIQEPMRKSNIICDEDTALAGLRSVSP